MAKAENTSDTEMLERLQREAFQYFVEESHPDNGLVADSTEPDSPASISVTGLSLTTYPVGVERGFIPRQEGIDRTLAALRFFHNTAQGTEPDGTGYKGFYYHFLDLETGQRARESEIATMDTAMLLAGGLAAAQYFDRDTKEEKEIRRLADALYRRADWQWAQGHGGPAVVFGWTPEQGFLDHRWDGHDESQILYALGLGSPTHPLSEESYQKWLSNLYWKTIYDINYFYAGPLFIHQFSHMWIDFRDIQDEVMREKGIDYFENSCRATRVQQEYAIRNPFDFERYGKYTWGITACDGPGPTMRKVDGIVRNFYGYKARGAPYGPDDGTLAPWAAVASLPFLPDVVLPTIRYLLQSLHLEEPEGYGFRASFNATFPEGREKVGWVSPWNYGLNQGPMVVMIENYRTGLIWRLMRDCPYLVQGLKRAGFRGGWLSGAV
jgi:hypothetical protein